MAHDVQAILLRPQNPEEKEDEMYDPEDLPGCSDADLEQAEFEADAEQAQADQDAVYGKTKIHTTVEAFAEATGLSVEFIQAHGITSYNSATLVPLHEPQEDTNAGEVARVRAIIDGGTARYDDDGNERIEVAECLTCGRSWNDARISELTPTPAGRCPFEYAHKEAK